MIYRIKKNNLPNKYVETHTERVHPEVYAVSSPIQTPLGLFVVMNLFSSSASDGCTPFLCALPGEYYCVTGGRDGPKRKNDERRTGRYDERTIDKLDLGGAHCTHAKGNRLNGRLGLLLAKG